MDIEKLNALKEKMGEIPQIGYEGHWSGMKFRENILEDSLVRHVLGLSYYQMSDVGEVFETLCKIEDGDEDWINAWSQIAEKLQKRAEKAENDEKMVSASNIYLRASTYWRLSLMYFNSVDDERIKEYSKNSFDCYEKYLKLSSYPGQYIEIPYENGYLPAHFYRSKNADRKAPILILTPGRDTWAEDTRWVYDAALKRGIHCLVYDGPGQGLALRLNDLKFRPDIENVLSPIIDFVLDNFDEVDGGKIISMGLSFGGFLVPRAAIYDDRIKITICDPGNINWGKGFIPKLEVIKQIPKDVRPPQLDFLLQDYVYKHGVSEDEIIDELKKFDNSSIIDKLESLTIVLDGSSEINKGEAKKFFDILNCPKEYLLFDENSSAQMHCQMGGYATAAEYIFDLLEEKLRDL